MIHGYLFVSEAPQSQPVSDHLCGCSEFSIVETVHNYRPAIDSRGVGFNNANICEFDTG